MPPNGTGRLIALSILGSLILMRAALAVGESANAEFNSAASAPASPAVEDDTERPYPSLPGAIHEPPEWTKKSFPFDIARHFVTVLPAENAAPVYLDALYEFGPDDMESCISPKEREIRGPALKERFARTRMLLFGNQPAGDAAQLVALAAEHQQSFEKLAQAQIRKQCVFETGLGVETSLPHLIPARTAARLLVYRTEGDLARNRIDSALDNVEMALRLGRDLRPRGFVITQAVSISIDSHTLDAAVPKILGHAKLKTAHCDRLLEIIARHIKEGADPLRAGFRFEYLALRDLLHRLELKEDLGPRFGAPGTTNGMVLARQIARGDEKPDANAAVAIDKTLATMSAADYADEIDSLNRYYGPLIDDGNRPRHELAQLRPEQRRAAGKMKLVKELCVSVPAVVDACRRDTTRIRATQCLVALRRWQLTHSNKVPADLLTACIDAGMKSVPIDEFSVTGEPLRFTTLEMGPVIYSVGSDGKDDRAQLDWNWGKSKGDWIFRLPPVP